MPMLLCPNCRTQLVTGEAPKATVACPHCGQHLLVPGAPTALHRTVLAASPTNRRWLFVGLAVAAGVLLLGVVLGFALAPPGGGILKPGKDGFVEVDGLHMAVLLVASNAIYVVVENRSKDKTVWLAKDQNEIGEYHVLATEDTGVNRSSLSSRIMASMFHPAARHFQNGLRPGEIAAAFVPIDQLSESCHQLHVELGSWVAVSKKIASFDLPTSPPQKILLRVPTGDSSLKSAVLEHTVLYQHPDYATWERRFAEKEEAER